MKTDKHSNRNTSMGSSEARAGVHLSARSKNRARPTILLNPGPVTMSERVRQKFLEEDLCHREPEFARLVLDIKFCRGGDTVRGLECRSHRFGSEQMYPWGSGNLFRPGPEGSSGDGEDRGILSVPRSVQDVQGAENWFFSLHPSNPYLCGAAGSASGTGRSRRVAGTAGPVSGDFEKDSGRVPTAGDRAFPARGSVLFHAHIL